MVADEMAGRTAERLVLPRKLHRAVVRLSRSTSKPHRLVERAKIIRMACDGLSNAEVGRRVGVTAQTVAKWRERIASTRKLTALEDTPRSGRPSVVPTEVRCSVVKLACDRPEKTPFRNTWTLKALQDAIETESGWRLSITEIRRILHCEGIRPHFVRMWLHSPDPEFEPKVARICDLYVRPPRGATVVCVDEKTGMQALERIHPTHHLRREVRYEFEYARHGTSTLIAAFDIKSGEVFGRIRRRTAAGLMRFMEELARKYPTGPVYVIWDNLNIHGDGPDQRWTRFNQRHGGRFHFVHTPKHASWLNQIELWFSILQRRVLRHGSFATRAALEAEVRAFIRHWNRVEAHPFRWTFRGISRSVLAEAA
jgi:transposase